MRNVGVGVGVGAPGQNGRHKGGAGVARALAVLCASFTLSSSMLLVGVQPAAAAPVVGNDVTYTTDADFDKGTLVNVNHDAPNSNQLQLNRFTGTFKFIWVALSQRCTIAKINTETNAILGEYRTISDGAPCQESSRTTVSLDGSVWVGHRGLGGVTHVGLVELNGCVDRNGNGTIETSTGYGDVKPWTGSGSVLANAQDECILHHVDTAAAGLPGDSRHMSIDANGKLWVGDFAGGSKFIRINGSTGAIETPVRDLNCGGYGGLIDKNGVIWSAQGPLLRWDPNAPDSATNPRCISLPIGVYGLAIDQSGSIWASEFGSRVVKVSSDGNTVSGPFNHGSTTGAQGLAVDSKGDVWVSSSLGCGGGCTVGHLKNDGTFVGNVPSPTGSGSTGVSVDAAGKIWTANRSSNTATRIDPNAGPLGCGGTGCADGVTRVGAVDGTVNFPATAGPPARPLPFPYNYSDMTGQQLFNSTSPQGTWTVVQDGGAAGTEWGKVTWNTEAQGNVPPGASIVVEARAADTEAGLGGQSYAAVTSGTTFNLIGRFIQVRVTMKPDADNNSPVLSDIRIQDSPKIMISVDDVTVSEGDSGFTNATFTVSLSQPAGSSGVTVQASTANGTATAPGDYATRTNVPISFAAGEQSKPFAVQVVGDLVDEPTETFLVNLSAPTNATIADGQGVGTITDDDRNGKFSCRASALRLGSTEPVVANAANSPCKDESKSVATVNVGTSGPLSTSATASVVAASTDQTPDDLESAPPSTSDNGTAVATVDRTKIVIAGVTVEATVLRSQAKVACAAAPGGGLAPVLSGSSTIASLKVNGLTVNTAGSSTISMLGITIQLNGTTTTATSLTQTALRVSAPLVPAVVVAEARANFSGNPCAQ